MALMMKRTASLGPAPQRSRCVAVCAQQSKAHVAAAVSLVSLAVAAPAFAGVVLEQPQLKKVFQSDATTAAAPAAAKKTADAPKKKVVVESTSEGGVSPQAVALPAALVVVGGGAFALTTVDAGFSEFMRTAAVKDSGEDGAGYETALKGDGPIGKPKKAGTTKKAAPKKGSGPSNPLSGLFGSK